VAHETLAALLAQRIRGDGASPFVTFYDLESGERTELSAVTFGNWVDKTAGFARDELNLHAGERVHIALPLHWQTLVWWAACARASLVITDDAAAAVHVVGPDQSQWTAAGASGATQIAALSLQPWGRVFASPPPAYVRDFADEVRLFPDVFAEPAPLTSALVIETAGAGVDQAALVASAREAIDPNSVGESMRILVPDSPATAGSLDEAVRDLLVLPLVNDASLVLVRHAAAGNLALIEEQERTTGRRPNPLA
jgi:uncharacterized protein (TIGR03089 family)